MGQAENVLSSNTASSSQSSESMQEDLLTRWDPDKVFLRVNEKSRGYLNQQVQRGDQLVFVHEALHAIIARHIQTHTYQGDSWWHRYHVTTWRCPEQSVRHLQQALNQEITPLLDDLKKVVTAQDNLPFNETQHGADLDALRTKKLNLIQGHEPRGNTWDDRRRRSMIDNVNQRHGRSEERYLDQRDDWRQQARGILLDYTHIVMESELCAKNYSAGIRSNADVLKLGLEFVAMILCFAAWMSCLLLFAGYLAPMIGLGAGATCAIGGVGILLGISLSFAWGVSLSSGHSLFCDVESKEGITKHGDLSDYSQQNPFDENAPLSEYKPAALLGALFDRLRDPEANVKLDQKAPSETLSSHSPVLQ